MRESYDRGVQVEPLSWSISCLHHVDRKVDQKKNFHRLEVHATYILPQVGVED